ncbi:hypothetical protein BDY21DRAFT_395606, partial [Lineolata rhizophorae]
SPTSQFWIEELSFSILVLRPKSTQIHTFPSFLKMRRKFLLFPLLAHLVARPIQAQEDENTDVQDLIDGAVSLFTEATSVLGPVYTQVVDEAQSIIDAANSQNAAASSTTSDAASSSATEASSSTTASASSSTAAESSSLTFPSTLSISSSLSNALPTSSSTAEDDSSDDDDDNNIPIIVGTVLGAVVLALLILLVWLVLRRRKNKKRGGYTTTNSDIEGWNNATEQPDMAATHDARLHSQLMGRDPISGAPVAPAAAATAAGAGLGARHHHRHQRSGSSLDEPDLADHPAFRNESTTSSSSRENPFTPVPPPPRRMAAPNSRPGLTDGMVPGQEPYLSGGANHGSGSGSNNSAVPLMWSRGSMKGRFGRGGGGNPDHGAGGAAAALAPSRTIARKPVPTATAREMAGDEEGDETLVEDYPPPRITTAVPPAVPDRSPKRGHSSRGSFEQLDQPRERFSWEEEDDELTDLQPAGYRHRRGSSNGGWTPVGYNGDRTNYVGHAW